MSKRCQPPNKDESAYMLRVKELGCYVGRHFPKERGKCCYGCEAHHITDIGRRQSHYDTIPLCFDHHNQQTRIGFGESIHNGKKTFQAKYGTQEEMLTWTKEQLI